MSISPQSCYIQADSPTTPSLEDLIAHGIRVADVRRRCPHAVQYTALRGDSCWLAADLTELFGPGRGVRP
jgi:hypothetical protein